MDLDSSAWKLLKRPAKYEVKTAPRERPPNVKEQIVRLRGFKNIHLDSEHVAEFEYQPSECKRPYRMVVVRKNLTIERGEVDIVDDIRFFFYITDDRESPREEIVFESNSRCNQENLIEQLKNGGRALRMPVDNLVSNWAYMVMAALAWNLKAWAALLLPETGRWRKKYRKEELASVPASLRKQIASRDGKSKYYCVNEEGKTVWLTDYDGDSMVNFIDRHKTRPFFLYWSPEAVHSFNTEVPKRLTDRTTALGKRSSLAGAIVSVDDQVGKLLRALDKHGLREKTLVIFTIRSAFR